MKRGVSSVWVGLVPLATLWPMAAEAATCELKVSTATASVGQPIVAQASCSLEESDAKPTGAKLDVGAGAQAEGPSVGSFSRATMRNFSFQTVRGYNFTWTVYASKPGNLNVGPAVIQTQQGSLTTKSATVRILDPATNMSQQTRPRSGAPDPFDFDPFDFMRGRMPQAPSQPELERASELDLPRAPKAGLFLRTVLSRTDVVVGEPVRVTVYVYIDRSRQRIQLDAAPNTTDFLSFPLELDPLAPPKVADVGGAPYTVARLFDAWVVPIKEGTFSFEGAKATSVAQGVGRTTPKKLTSPSVKLRVTPPPEKERPEGYRIGDAGQFEWDVEVLPRELHEGDFFELRVHLHGKGDPPSKIPLPAIPRIEWQESKASGDTKAEPDGLVGDRTILIAGKVTGVGALDLGELRLPYFDTKSRSYATLSQGLGAMEVRPGSVRSAPPSTPTTTSEPVHAPITATVRKDWPPARANHAIALGYFWAPPGAAALASGLVLLARRRRREAPKRVQLPAWKVPPAQEHEELPQRVKLLEGELYRIVEVAFAENLRGLARDRLGAEFEGRGVDAELAAEIASTLLALVESRYASPPPPLSPLENRVRDVHEKFARWFETSSSGKSSPKKRGTP